MSYRHLIKVHRKITHSAFRTHCISILRNNLQYLSILPPSLQQDLLQHYQSMLRKVYMQPNTKVYSRYKCESTFIKTPITLISK